MTQSGHCLAPTDHFLSAGGTRYDAAFSRALARQRDGTVHRRTLQLAEGGMS